MSSKNPPPRNGEANHKAHPSLEQREKALGHFKDWSNYLLVTTVAALGWVSTTEKITFTPPCLRGFIVWCFAVSIFFGILTLALIPLIAEQMEEDDKAKTIYEVDVDYRIWFITDRPPFLHPARLKWFCFPQHMAFLLGILLYALGGRIGSG